MPWRPAKIPAPDREGAVLRLTAACTAALQAAIRRHPSKWVWLHERRKTRPEGDVGPTQAKPVPESAELSGG
jgi:KDO2-lipid IV(A) lauroyltransferase